MQITLIEKSNDNRPVQIKRVFKIEYIPNQDLYIVYTDVSFGYAKDEKDLLEFILKWTNITDKKNIKLELSKDSLIIKNYFTNTTKTVIVADETQFLTHCLAIEYLDYIREANLWKLE